MSRFLYSTKQNDGFPVVTPPLMPSPSSSIPTPHNISNHEKESTTSPPFNGASPILLLVIMILAAVFFISGLLHLLVRFLTKRPSFSPIFHSNRFPEASRSNSLQRQLQQLFRLHDSGLEQASIDALPVFYYKDIMGTKEPFDCAVCLCEFSDMDKLRLLPICSHAFHIDCIETWLLSNSTCPLCRATLSSSGIPMDNPFFNFGPLSREVSGGLSREGENGTYNCQKPVTVEENIGEKRIFSVRLGKFRSLNGGGGHQEETGQGETSRCNLDTRRCYSMGTVQYVVGDSYLQVALSQDNNLNGRGGRDNACPPADGDVEDKKITGRSRGESFSVSKIWQWSKSKRSTSPNTHFVVSSLTLG